MPFVLLSLILLSCSHTEKDTVPAKTLYETALKQKEKKQYIQALETLTKLRKQFIYSPYSAQAQKLMADIYFEREDYTAATKEYKKLLKLYPKTDRDHALYQLGLAHLNRLPKTADRDISLGKKALKYFRELVQLKGQSPYKKKARERMKSLLALQAEKEFKIAVFYKRRGLKRASLKRLEHLFKKYPESPRIPQALLLASQIAEGGKALKFKNRLLKKFPDSPSAGALKKSL